MAMRLKVENLSAGYPGEDLVCRGISFDLAREEMIGIIGPNGAGKSTLLRAIAGLLPLREGTISWDGRSLPDLTGKARARCVAMLPQELRAIAGASVRSFVESGRYPHRTWFGTDVEAETAAVNSAMDRAGVDELADRLLDELSGGQRQRVLLARALAQDADLLLVDEPTSSLDPRHQIRTFDRLRATVKDGRSALIVTHDLNLASQYMDRLGLLSEGRLMALGRPDEILNPEVLEAIYGEDLHIGRLPCATAGEDRPFVLPWRR